MPGNLTKRIGFREFIQSKAQRFPQSIHSQAKPKIHDQKAELDEKNEIANCDAQEKECSGDFQTSFEVVPEESE